jgi:hypothetical protein
MRELWRAATICAVLAVTAMSACSKGEGTTGPAVTPPPATPVGTYTLSSIDAKSMPYMMYSDTGYTLELSSGTLSVTTGGRWVSKVVSKETVAGNVSTYTDSTFGTWALGTAATTAVFTNTETSSTSTVTWTAKDVTVNDVDGTVTRKILYKKN